MKHLLFFLLCSVSMAAQTPSLNSYQYALVPAKFEFLRENDQYKLNTYTKMFLEKYGFKAYLSDEILPDDFAQALCNKVYVDLEEDNNMFVTKLKVVIKDCRNNVLWISEEGTSREKDLQKGYQQALRAAFNSFDNLNYKYGGKLTEPNQDSQVVLKETFNEQEISKPLETAIYDAQPIENGFQIVDSSPKIVLKIYRSSQPDLYIAEGDKGNGFLRRAGDQWVFEHYQNGKLLTTPMNIRF